MHFFFLSDINANIFQTNEEESKHISRVLRLTVGDDVVFTNGKGNLYNCVLIDNHPKRCLFEVRHEDVIPKRKYYLHIAVAPTKNISRLEWFLEKATEMGIDEITPIKCAYSERTAIKPERLRKILVSALKQSQQAWIPKLNDLTSFSELIKKEHNVKKCIAYVSNDHNLLLKEYYKMGNDVLILIGPEGDFSDEETKSALRYGFKPISLGENRLRTETAAVVACHTVVLLNQ